MGYMEALPLQCPPQDAQDVAYSLAFRIVFSNPPTNDDFKSRAALGMATPAGVSDCRNASCSLSADVIKLRNQALLPKFRAKKPKIAHLSIGIGSGRSCMNVKSSHIDFWMYDTFNPISATSLVEDV
jgi:hypothetical protein